MHSIQYNPIADGEFTKELLDANFKAIGDYTIKTADYLAQINAQTVYLRAEVEEIAKQVAQLSKPKGSILPLLVGAAAGVYLYSQFRVRWQVGQRNGEFGKGPKKEEPIKTEAHRADQPNA